MFDYITSYANVYSSQNVNLNILSKLLNLHLPPLQCIRVIHSKSEIIIDSFRACKRVLLWHRASCQYSKVQPIMRGQYLEDLDQ